MGGWPRGRRARPACAILAAVLGRRGFLHELFPRRYVLEVILRRSAHCGGVAGLHEGSGKAARSVGIVRGAEEIPVAVRDVRALLVVEDPGKLQPFGE